MLYLCHFCICKDFSNITYDIKFLSSNKKMNSLETIINCPHFNKYITFLVSRNLIFVLEYI